MAYTRHHSYPKYFYYGQGGRPTAPAYASKGNRPNESDIKNIRLKTSDYYLTRINADRRNRVMNQRSDYLFVDRKPECLPYIEREEFGGPVKNTHLQRQRDVNYECFNRFFNFRVNDGRKGFIASVPSDPRGGCGALEDNNCRDRQSHSLDNVCRRRRGDRPQSPAVVAELKESMTRNPGSLASLSARSNIWPHNSQFPNKSLRAERNPSVDPLNTTFNNNNVNSNNNNNNDRDDNRCTSNNWRGPTPPHPAYNDEKMTRMRRSYRYVPPAPARYPHASSAACDRYDQLGLMLRGNIMLSSTYRENNGTEFRRSYTQEVADRRVPETDEFNMQKDELSKWNELRVVYDNILRDYGKRLQEDKDKKQAGST